MGETEISLQVLILGSFDEKELKDLCRKLNVNPQDFSANSRVDLARELIIHCEKNNHLPSLIDGLKEERPLFIWPSADRPFTRAQLIDEVDKPLLHFEPETIEIPASSFIMGRESRDGIDVFEAPIHRVALERYWLGKFPVTNIQYEPFVREMERPVVPEMGWVGRIPMEGQEKFPITAVSWHDALAYCDWLSKKTGKQYSIPNEAQWERAARSTDGRSYPWGNDWEDGRCNWGGEGLAAVDAFDVQSEDGFFDLVGNIRQWTRSLWGEKPSKPDDNIFYPWSQDKHDPDDITSIASHKRRIFRGSASSDTQEQCRCFSRRSYMPDKIGPPGKRHGFRVVLVK